MKKINNCFSEIVSDENLWNAWRAYRHGKHERAEVREFEDHLEEHLLRLRADVIAGTYSHGPYRSYIVHDPKRRLISAPTIRDHLVHQAVYQVLVPHYERWFYPHSFSCRVGRGTRGAREQLQTYMRRASKNWRRRIWVLHGDIEKCFDAIPHDDLLHVLAKRITCTATWRLLRTIIESFRSGRTYDGDPVEKARGIPLGNLTSQLFVNAYLHALDWFVKEYLRCPYYVRYADDFFVVGDEEAPLQMIAEYIRHFVSKQLHLRFPNDHQKLFSLSRGVETLGLRFLPQYSMLIRRRAKKMERGFRSRCAEYAMEQRSALSLDSSWQSVRGMALTGQNWTFRDTVLQQTHTYV